MTQPIDSQELLAASIARAVQLDLAIPGRPDLADASEAALLKEASDNERDLAFGRVVALVGYVVYLLTGHLRPDLFGVAELPFINVLAAVLWLAAAAALFIRLRRGFYHRLARRVLPVIDAAAVAAVTTLLHRTVAPGGGAPVGISIAGITACALIAFSGSLRLSYSAARFATAGAVIAAIFVAASGGMRVVEIVFAGAAVLATGLLSSRLTRVIRRVITNEIARVQLGRLYDDARQATAAREEVLKIVSHDLRNPLNTIGMAAELLQETRDEAARERTVGMIQRTTSRMNRMIQDLLDVAKLEAGRLAIEVEPVNVRDVMQEALETLSPLATTAGLTLTGSVSEDAQALVDRGRIQQVLSNLVGNAIKFTPAGGRITVEARVRNGMIRFGVRDTGPGIPAEQLERLFGRFWQAQPSDRRGLGLGLAIAKSIVEAHGGEIGVISEAGSGAEFWFTVPGAVKPAALRS